MGTRNDLETVWHVTRHALTRSIIDEGFLGGCGDDGYGVYVFNNLLSAEDYMADGGWDGEGDPAQMCIVQIEVAASELWEIEVHPEWENPEDYEHILRYPMEPDSEELWTPARQILTECSDPELL